MAPFYDLWTAPMELLGGRRRRGWLVASLSGKVLEVGTGTGASLALFPAGVEVTGIDVSPRMLARARRRTVPGDRRPALGVADVEALPFSDAMFDHVVAACVFCSVDDPVMGLREVGRVLRPGGSLRLVEHVRPRNRTAGWVFDQLTPVVRRWFGPSINRDTEGNVAAAGLRAVEVRRTGIWREIVAIPQRVDAPR